MEMPVEKSELAPKKFLGQITPTNLIWDISQ